MRRLAWPLIVCALTVRCAPTIPVEIVPGAPHYPEFVYPEPPASTPKATADRLARGWRLLQANDVAAADREFADILKIARDFAPATVATGYVELARQRPREALARFDAVLPDGRPDAPALVGRGLALLAAGRDDDALGSFESALATDARVPDLASRVETLRARVAQDRVGRAERAAAAGRWDDARVAYRAAITASPESAFLHRDLAFMERRAGHADQALASARAALALDADDARAHVLVGDLLADADDTPGALEAYRRAAALDPSPATDAAIARMRDRAREAALPPQYHGIGDRLQATRADVAALLGVRLGPTLARAPQRQVVVTDVRGHWADAWIQAVTRAGAMEVFSNYTFQPSAPLRRGDLADAVNRVLDVLALGNAAAAVRWDRATIAVADLTPDHLAYRAVRRSVAAGVLPLHDDGAFRLLSPVSGAEVIEAVTRLVALTGGGRR